MMVEHFNEIVKVDEVHIEILMKCYRIHIHGRKLHLLALGKAEILIEGIFENIAFAYDE